MKTKLTLITLIACAAAGTTFAADPVEAFRASSGTTTNSADTIYVGNTDWGSDSKEIGDAHVADLWSKYGPEDSFEWDPEKKAFYTHTIIDSFGGVEKEYESYDFVFVLDEDAQFENAKDAAMSFRYEGETAYESGGYDIDGLEYFVTATNMIVFAGSSKFTNAGTLTFGSKFTGSNQGNTNDKWKGDTPPGFLVFQRDKAVFENKGTISAEPNNYVEWVEFDLFGNAKFVNAEGGEIKGMGFCLYGDSVVENAGLLDNSGLGDKPYVALQENAKFVNTGTIVGETGYNFEFAREMTGTSKIENRGKMTNMSDVTFMYLLHGDETLSGVSATFENRGEISAADGYGVHDIRFEADFENKSDVDFIAVGKANLAASDLNVKNYGKIDLGGTGSVVVVGTGVKLTLAEGSSIVGGNVSIGVGGTPNDSGVIPIADKDVLVIELTGKGGSEALISGDLDLCNRIELDVSFAEDAVQLKKYELKIWDGELRFKEYYSESDYGSAEKTPDAGFIEDSLTGTLDAFDTTYIWSLDTATGVLTAKDVNFSEKVTVTSSTQSVLIGPKDVATIAASLTEYSGKLVGSGEVRFGANLTFTGDASGFSGTTKISDGTLTIAETAQLGTGAFELSDGGVLKVDEGVTLSSNVTILVSGTDFYVSDAALIGDGTFSGTVTLDAMLAEAVALAGIEARSTTGALTYKIFGEDLDHSGADVRLSDALLEAGWTLTMNADGTVSVSLIPEPSAFGALAGLGALALVASRRRRK